MRISELLLEKNDLLPDSVIAGLVGPFIMAYIEALPGDDEVTEIIVRHQEHMQALDLTLYFDVDATARPLAKPAARKVEDRFEMAGDWQYQRRTERPHGKMIDMVYSHDFEGSHAQLKASFEKAFGKNMNVVTIVRHAA
jgi:hypothetical protein